jgi:hypothetical protein
MMGAEVLGTLVSGVKCTDALGRCDVADNAVVEHLGGRSMTHYLQ